MSVDTTRMVVVVNPRSGPKGNDKGDEIRATFEAVGITPEVIFLEKSLDLRKLIGEKIRHDNDVVVAAGGDGTISAVGSLLAGSDIPLGILPTGTLNHFAKDLGLPLDLNAAAEVIARGQTTSVDVGEVNGRVFLNNSSIGLYPTTVTERERLTQRGLPKSVATCLAALIALSRFPNTTVRVTTDRGALLSRTPLVFVGNNHYEFSGLQAGKREKLDDGMLQVTMLNHTSRLALIKAIAQTIAGIGPEPNMFSVETEVAKIATLRRRVKVALDGEIVRLRSPLHYRVRPNALRVIVDRRDGDGTVI